jgi:hypothetical protein
MPGRIRRSAADRCAHWTVCVAFFGLHTVTGLAASQEVGAFPVIDHITVLAICLPLFIGLGILNSRLNLLTPGEIRFWGVCTFVAVEFIYLGLA